MALYRVLRPIEHDGKLYQPVEHDEHGKERKPRLSYKVHTTTRDQGGNARDDHGSVAHGGEIVELTDEQAAQFTNGQIEPLVDRDHVQAVVDENGTRFINKDA